MRSRVTVLRVDSAVLSPLVDTIVTVSLAASAKPAANRAKLKLR